MPATTTKLDALRLFLEAQDCTEVKHWPEAGLITAIDHLNGGQFAVPLTATFDDALAKLAEHRAKPWGTPCGA